MTNERGTKDDRKWTNFIIAPDRQFRLTVIAGGIGLVFFFGFFAFQIWLFSTLIMSLVPFIPPGTGLEGMIQNSIQWSWIVFGVVGVCFLAVCSGAVIIVSHRIYGPIVAIRKHLAAVVRGEFDYRTHLRKNDEFQDVARDLNDLSEALQVKARTP
jgi:sensor histidine kinase YesM